MNRSFRATATTDAPPAARAGAHRFHGPADRVRRPLRRELLFGSARLGDEFPVHSTFPACRRGRTSVAPPPRRAKFHCSQLTGGKADVKFFARSQGERWWLNAFATVWWWAAVFALWTVFGLLITAWAQLRFGPSQGLVYADWLPTMLPFYWVWVPLTPAVVVLAEAMDFRAGRRVKSLLGLLAAGCVAVLIHGALYALIMTLVQSADGAGGLGGRLVHTLREHAAGSLATYAALAGAVLTLQAYRRAQVRERDVARAAIRASRLEAQLSAARLDALQMQLRPHFLFNTLNSISVMVLKGAGPEAIRAIRQLGDLLRTTLHSAGAQEVPLQEEVAFVQGYLDIERLRFGDRLRVGFEIPDDAAVALVPHLILQPLVENAIVHGLADRLHDGHIRVVAHRDAETLNLEVWDNGAGLPANAAPTQSGVGLSNVRARLRELYGEAAHVHVVSATEGGTRASIALPYHTEARPAAVASED
jgi:signal transduction histidine kinase